MASTMRAINGLSTSGAVTGSGPSSLDLSDMLPMVHHPRVVVT